MASVIYNEAKRAIAAGELDLNAHDIRCRLVMTDTTVDTEDSGIVNIADFTTVDVMDGSGYVDKAMANEAVNKDDPNSRVEFDGDDITWSSLGAGARAVQGVLLFRYIDGTDANDIPIAFLEFASNFTADGSDLLVVFDAEGILQFL